jgi:hypothetical protein
VALGPMKRGPSRVSGRPRVATRQAPVQGEEEGGAQQTAEQVEGEVRQGVDDYTLQGAQVGGEARDDIADLSATVVAHRQPLQVVEHVQADVVEDPSAQAREDIVSPDSSRGAGDEPDQQASEHFG